MITQTLKLNLIPGQVLPRVNVSQYDAGTRTLQMLLYNGDQTFNISAGVGGFVQGTKPDKTGFQYPATVTQGSNVVTLVITQQMTVVSGEVTCELVLADGDNRIATVNFILYVEPAALADDTVISETDLPLIEEAAELAQRIDGIAADVEADADRAETAADNAKLWASRSPYIGQNGNWFVFDTTTGAYVDTQIPATGPQGPQGDDGPIGPTGPTGPTGNGIVSITKTGTSGLVDTYTITFTDGTTTTFTVTNGQDGQGAGDMTKAVYDSTNAVADAGGIVAYVAAHSGAGTLAGLDDVTLSSLAAGDTLVYNATTQKWENSTVIQTLTNQVKDMNNVYGSKNLLPYPYYENRSSLNGITYVINSDGSVTFNGTATATAYFNCTYTNKIVDFGDVSFSSRSNSNTFYKAILKNGSNDIYLSYNASNKITAIIITSGTVCENLTVYPMIRLASITDDTYEPYAMTNRELTTENQTLSNKTYKTDDSTETAIADDDYIPFYDSSTQTTKKISKANAKFGGGALYFTGVACAATTGNFVSKSDSNITANHVVASVEYANPSAITSDVGWTTANRSVKLNGTCASATTCSIVLVKKDN